SGGENTMNSLIGAFFALLLASPAAPVAQPAEKTFDSPRQAADALIQAAASDDMDALMAIFGPSGKKIVTSADAVKDKNDREKFAELAKAKTEVTVDKKDPHRAILSVGTDDWPFPVPIVETNGKWHFATKDGLREVLYRRIGQDELDAMEVCR